MSFLTDTEIKEKFGPDKDEVQSWLKKKRLPNTRANRALATRKITAAKIKKTLGKEIAVLESSGNWQVIYGECRVGGTITFAHTTGNNENLHLVVTIAGHEIDSVQKLYLDGQEVIFGASPDPRWSTGIKDLKTGQVRAANNKVFMAVNNGNPANAAIADLIGQCPDKWTSDHKQTGRAHVYILMRWDAILFPNGRPEISFLVRGKKCYDPRSGTTAWTQNPALQILDYLTNTEFGLGAALADCETAVGKAGSFRTAADVCDQAVGLLAGGNESRYTGNGYFEIGETHQTIIEEICTAYAGSITFSNGKWKSWPATWRSPSITLTENDILSDLRVSTRISRRDNFNAVKGTFVSPLANYEETDFPAVRNSFYKAQDNNEEIFEDIQLPFTQSAATAQRIAKIELERIRQPIKVELTATLKAWQVEAGETINITWSRFGWTAKTFEVEETEPIFEGNDEGMTIGIRMVLKETASGVYDWNSGQETRFDLAPNTTLPDAFTVQTPTGITIQSGTAQLYIRSDGTVFSRMRVAWTPMLDFFVNSGGQIEIQYRQYGVSSWSVATAVPGDLDFTHILDVQDGQIYEVRLRAKSAFGVYSPYTSIYQHTVVGKTEPPSNVSGFAGQIGNFGIFFTWNKIPDLDVAFYELRLGDLSSNWDTAIVTAQVAGDSKQIDLKLTGSYRFFIKAVDTSGNYSTNATQLTLNVAGPSAPVVSFGLTGANLTLNWAASSGVFEVREYEIRFGTTFASATVEATIKGTSYARKVDWNGLRRYWVVARDVAGNMGTETAVDVNITAPGTVNALNVEVVDNNVLLKWQAPSTGNLPVEYYRVLKGADFNTATAVGQVGGTFCALFEILAGEYTYWIVARDTAGNNGQQTPIAAIVNEPPDFVVLDDQILDPDTGYGVNYYIENDELFLAIYSSESWEDHYLNNGWTTPQDQINAGYPYFMQPTAEFGYWEKVLDFGTVLDATLIKCSFVQTDIAGTPIVDCFLAYSLDGISWTETQATQIFGQNFQYVKVRLQKGTLPAPSGTAMGVLGLTYP